MRKILHWHFLYGQELYVFGDVGISLLIGLNNLKTNKIMEIVLLHFTLTAINLFSAQRVENMNRNPRLQYFCAGITFGLGISSLIKFILK